MTVTFGPRIADRWEPAPGLHRRGTVVVLPGRGEHGQVYERLGRRLASDAYVALVVDALPTTPIEELVVLVREIQSPDRPLVLLGSDTGGLEALQIAVLAEDLVDAVVVAGLPVTDPQVGGVAFTGPVLVLHGDADRITPLARAAASTQLLTGRQLVTVAGARHDVLNDPAHQFVAAEIVQFLEQVRVGARPVVSRSA